MKPSRDRGRQLLALALGLPILAGTPVPPVAAGPVASAAFQVNTATAGNQLDPAVAVTPTGGSVVVWASQQDGSGLGVYAQRYDEAGVPLGGETRVNTVTSADQSEPSIAMSAGGDYVVVWTSDNQDGSSLGIYAQRYDATGLPQGEETRINSTTANEQSASSVAMDAEGDYVVTWQSNLQDGSSFGIYAQRYDATGTPRGGETRVNATVSNRQHSPDVAIDATGNYVVTWTSLGQDGSFDGIYHQRYNAAGTLLGPETRVNTTTLDDQFRPSVALDLDGNYIIVWESQLQDDSSDGSGIYLQRYRSNGSRYGTETLVNTTTLDDQVAPSVAMAANGTHVVTWSSGPQDGSGFGVYAQRYRADGSADGPESRVNTYVFGQQLASGVAPDADGDFFITWTSDSQDGSGSGVFARRFRGPVPVDLALAQTDDRDPVAVDGKVTYRLRVTNLNEPVLDTGIAAIDRGTAVATGVYVVSTFPDGATLSATSGSGWSCSSSSTTARCRLTDPLPAGTVSPTLSLHYTLPDDAGPALHTARVHAHELDPVAANNAETERTAVECFFEFNSPAYSIGEANPSATIVVARRGSNCGAAVVDVVSGSASATPDLDYGVVNETLVFADSNTNRSFTVPIAADALDEKAEQVKLRLTDPTDGLLGTRRAVNLTILDDDLPPRINFVTTSGAGSEPGAVVEATLRLSEVSGQVVSVTLATTGTASAGVDYFAPTRVVIPAGQRTVSFDLEVVDDAVVEGVENARLTIAAPVAATLGSVRAFVLTITSDD